MENGRKENSYIENASLVTEIDYGHLDQIRRGNFRRVRMTISLVTEIEVERPRKLEKKFKWLPPWQ